MQLENLKGAPAAFSIYKRNHFAKKAYSNDISSEMGRSDHELDIAVLYGLSDAACI